MADSKKRWTVTYTKHVNQKRKVYQDGFLVLNVSATKLSLYDECEKLLECRLLKSDETVASGESLTFNGHLVDIGSLEGENKPESQLKVDKKQNNVFRFRTPDVKVKAKETIRTQKPLSPSQKIIKEFKKREIHKYRSPKISQETPKPSSKEWQVLYTSQMTQKAKKYHDGFLRLDLCGSRGTQARLFDASRTLLDSRFLKKEDVIKPGESITFDTYLVDISEDQVSHTPDSSVKGNNCSNVKRIEKIDRQKTSLDTDSHATVGKCEWKVLYTTQLTQKAKKYHDGFLQLECCGSHGRQVILYDLSKRPLERRFLKIDEVIEAGSMVYFAGHLVDVGEPEGSHQSSVKLSEQGTDGENVVEKRQQRHGQNVRRELHPSTAKGQPSSRPSLRQDAGLNSQSSIKSNKAVPVVKPLRDVNQILSFLQDPKAKPRECYITGCGSPNKSYQNILDSESMETTKSPDITPTKATSGGGSFQCRENVKVSHQSNSQKEAQRSINEADFDLLISSPDVHSSRPISNEEESLEEFLHEREEFPSFDLGF